ncbi:MAG: P-loop NTPase [Pseudomonadota bacterium]|nr:P-loop NTPase [Pseudomonadota bacterium]
MSPANPTANTSANTFNKQGPIPGIAKIIAVGSGKGGVGKSTVSANLAVAIAKLGLRVGLLDSDIYGPSIPRLFGAINQKALVDENNKIIPIERSGVKLMSLGFLVPEETAVVWRGPMLFKALEQFLRDVVWGDLDYLIIDLPPGTGDVPLTLAQKTQIHLGIAVTTPQNIAFADCKKALDMFGKLNIPVLGVVENMSYFKLPNGEKAELFPRGELDFYIAQNKMTRILQIPFTQNLAKSAEIGISVLDAFPQDETADKFIELANMLTKSHTATTQTDTSH